jgi:uncharacterized protein YndB with AHSA1/START domain
MSRITISISVEADMGRVWDYWTSPEHIMNWNFASDEWCCPSAKNDLKPNGKFSWRMEAKDGSMGFDFEGMYDIIIESKMISYTLTDNRKVDIEFTQNGKEVTVSETFDAEGTNSDELQRAGWQEILNNFKKCLESN